MSLAFRLRLATVGAVLALGVTAPAAAQTRLGATIAGGYAAGLDRPVLADGGLGLHASLWVEKRAGLEFGLGGGWDRYERSSTTTGGLFLDPASNSIGSTTCAGCIAGSAEQQSRLSGRYVTPMLRLRARTGALRPWGSVGLGVYSLRTNTRSAFLPADGSAPRATFNGTTDDLAVGGNLMVGLGLPIGTRVTFDAVTQLHGAFLKGDDFAGGAGWATLGAGFTIR